MPDVLSQSEVDALLSSVGGRGTGEAARQAERVRYYDFLRPERASAAEVRALEELQELVSRSLAVALSGALRLPVGSRLQSFEQVAWGEFLLGLPNPTCLAVVEAPTSGGRFALEIGPGVLYPIIERLLGSNVVSAGGASPPRPLTQIERRVAVAVVEMMLAALREAWRLEGREPLRVAQLETNPQTAMLAPPAEMAALARFELSLGEGGSVSGAAHVCIPFGPCREFLRELAALPGAATGAGGESAGAMARALLRVPLRLEAILARRRVPLREALALLPGSVVETGARAGDDVVLAIAGRKKLRASAGEYRGRKAVSVRGGFRP